MLQNSSAPADCSWFGFAQSEKRFESGLDSLLSALSMPVCAVERRVWPCSCSGMGAPPLAAPCSAVPPSGLLQPCLQLLAAYEPCSACILPRVSPVLSSAASAVALQRGH